MFLKQIREERGITQKDLAAGLGLQPNTISRYETGERAPDIKTLQDIADYLNVSIEILLTGEPKKTPFKEDVTFDDFTYAFLDESEELDEDDKKTLLDMARFLKEQKKRE